MDNLYNQSLLTLKDLTSKDILNLLDLAQILKENKKNGKTFGLLKGKNIVLIFEKTSTRTRCAFEVAAYDEGANVSFLTNSQMGKKESLRDTATVLGKFYDGIEFRGKSQKTVEDLKKYSGIPVWNGLTDEFHPTQVLADMLTIREHFGKLKGLKLSFLGDARNNMGNSLLIGCAKLGLDFTAIAPKELFPSPEIVKYAQTIAKDTGSSITLTEELDDIRGSDIVYTDIWVSMGEEDKIKERIELLKNYQVNQDLMNKTGKDSIFLHCLPSFHNTQTEFSEMVSKKYGLDAMEVTDEVFYAPYSLVFDEAENRLHTIKAVMCASLNKDSEELLNAH